MKTNELNNGIKEVYTKPALEVEEMEVQWGYLGSASQTSGGEQNTEETEYCYGTPTWDEDEC